MTDRQAVLATINANFNYCAEVYEAKDELTCINYCNSCQWKDVDESRYPCWQQRIADQFLSMIPQLDVYKQEVKNGK